MMKEYIAVRSQVEQAIRDAGLNATVLRPWYVLGPGHRWPYLLIPFYKVCESLPATREGARARAGDALTDDCRPGARGRESGPGAARGGGSGNPPFMSDVAATDVGPVSLTEIALLFLKLGTIAFGGPAAHVAMMEDEFVRRRKWLSHQEFLDRLGASNLIPGPSSTRWPSTSASASADGGGCW